MSNKPYETTLPEYDPNVNRPLHPPTTATDTTRRKLTPEEQEVVDSVAQRTGREWADAHIDLILGQFYSI